ncbi:MAG: TetR/AcrR family transcriptional regulator [Parvibaculaceae bacterium]
MMTAGYFQERAAGGKKRQRTRAALLDAAVAVVAEKGMEGAKISEMTTIAGLANGTFYNHFDSKEEILKAAAIDIALEVGRQLDAEMTEISDGPLRVATATSRFVSIALAHPDWTAVLLESQDYLPDASLDVFRFLRRDLEIGREQGVFHIAADQFTLEQISALIAAAIHAQLVRGPDKSLTQRLCENILRMSGVPMDAARRIAREGVIRTLF